MTKTARGFSIVGAVFTALLLIAAAALGPTLYRVLHGLDRYETTPPVLSDDLPQPAVLVFTKTNGFRDELSIRAATAMLRDIARERGWGLYQTENGAIFNPRQLGRFRAVVWASVSGDVLTVAQRKAFQDYLTTGGGFVGIHGAGGDPSYRWRWYVDHLVGTQFVGHTMWPEIQPGRIHIEDPVHPITAGLPRVWPRRDEWYSFGQSVRAKGYHVLATLDEASYHPRGIAFGSLRMGPDHPIVWEHCVGRGRAFYSALGHTPESYAEPLHRRLIGNAINWEIDDRPCRETPPARLHAEGGKRDR